MAALLLVEHCASQPEVPSESKGLKHASGFRSERFQGAVGFIGDRRVWKFLLELFVNFRRFLGIALAESLRELEQSDLFRHKNRRVVGKIAENLGSVTGLASALVNNADLILRHGGELFVFAVADFLELLKGLVLALEILVAKSCVVRSEAPGIRAGILCGHAGEFLRGRF